MGLFASLCALVGCNAQNAAFKSVDVTEFEKIIADNNIVRLDVRTPEEYAEGHIDGAINIDVKQTDFEKRAMALLPTGKTVALYCRSGRRSKKAAQVLAARGFDIVELESGIIGWNDAKRPVTTVETDIFATPGGKLVRIDAIKHGTLSINFDGKWIYIDPVTTAVKPVTDYSTMPRADIILITHEHGDHLDANAVRQLAKDGTRLVANANCATALKGVTDATVMANGDSLTVGDVKIDAVPAYNTGADKQQFHPRGRDNGFVLTIDGMRIYIAGDTENIPEMADINGIDVAFLPCNLPYTMTPEQVANAARIVKPKVLFPYHYAQTDIKRVPELLKNDPIDVRIRQYK